MNTFELVDERTCQFFERAIALRNRVEAELQGAFNLLIQQHGLEGRWELDLPNKQLIRSTDQRTQAA